MSEFYLLGATALLASSLRIADMVAFVGWFFMWFIQLGARVVKP
jgi:hypothetical protein